jgi:hypothetical protein
LHGIGRGYSPNRYASYPWFALGGGVEADGRIEGRFGWMAQAAAFSPLERDRFTVETAPGVEQTAYRASPAGVLIGAGIRLSIW